MYLRDTEQAGGKDYPARANWFLAKVNRGLSDPEHKVTYGDSAIALDIVSDVAAYYEGDTAHPGVVDRAYEVAAYLGGASITDIADDQRMSHIIDRRRYGAGTRDRSIVLIAKLAAERVAWVQDNLSPKQREELGLTENPTVNEEHNLLPAQSIDDVVRTLYAERALS